MRRYPSAARRQHYEKNHKNHSSDHLHIGFDYIAPDPTGDDLVSFFETVARKNWLDFVGVTFSEDDTVLTLSTCCRKYDKTNSGNQRLVVMAKLLPEGATAQEFNVSLVDDPEMS